jgi:hypothetical protein
MFKIIFIVWIQQKFSQLKPFNLRFIRKALQDKNAFFTLHDVY